MEGAAVDRRPVTPVLVEPGTVETLRPLPAACDPGGHLPVWFLEVVAMTLRSRGVDAAVEHPGVLQFGAAGRLWGTGLTGLHVDDPESGE